jgi:alkylation response protein AidB-like acyl-CoA dehydrogenase
MLDETSVAASRAALLDRVAAALPEWTENAARLDAEGRVPEAELRQLRDAGAFTAPLPAALDGLGLGTEPPGAPGLLRLLRLIGRANLSLGRIFEGHVNALKLVAVYGTAEQLRRAAEDARDGHLFAIWATEAADPVRIAGARPHARLRGGKVFCSAAAQATRALITATSQEGEARMLLIPLRAGERARASPYDTHGMRACGTDNVDFTGIPAPATALIGQPDDYLRQPEFSAGAWRASAVALGGLDALVEQVRRQLVARRRQDDPHQRARLGELFIAVETASLWAAKAAWIAEGGGTGGGDVAGYVNLARIAIEAACLDAMRLAQRSLGLAAFVRPNPVERLLRDLATYLRQPAPDETLTEAASWFTEHEIPEIPGGRADAGA